MGSAALCHLAKRGVRVLGLERHFIGHALGSSHGGSRVIRKAYAEEPRYVPLVLRAYELWSELEEETRPGLLSMTGGLHLGPPQHPSMISIGRAADEFDLAIERLSRADVSERFPVFELAETDVGFFEPDAGVLAVERAVAAHVEVAVRHGADVRLGVRATEINESGQGANVVTASGETFAASRIVFCPGPYANADALVRAVVPLRVSRQVQCWFQPIEPDAFAVGSFPLFIHHTDVGEYYGLPAVSRGGVKVCRHYGGPETSPDEIDREVRAADEEEVRRYLRRHLSSANGPRIGGAVCMYTNTPDQHFVIGLAPSRERTLVAAGFSGHGFKFSPTVGEILADVITRGETEHDLSLFDPGRAT